jgi:predicted nucleotidyltransferase
MKIEEAIKILRDAQPFLREKHVIHAGVFGSVARGEAGPTSDVDILIDFEPSAPITIYDYVSVQNDIAQLFPQRVDVIDSLGLKPRIRSTVTRDLVYAF